MDPLVCILTFLKLNLFFDSQAQQLDGAHI